MTDLQPILPPEAAPLTTAEADAPQPTFLVFDTETTGLPPRPARGEPPIPADDPRQPRMASFAAVLTDAQGRAISRHKFYVKPEGWSIDGTDAGRINGLTDAFLEANGVPVRDVLDFYSGHVEAGRIVVAFNAIFDTKILRGELRRAGMPDLFEQTRNICVMKACDPYGARGLCINRGFVKLAEACKFFGIVNENAHDAMADADAARGILEILIRDGLLPAPSVTYAKAAPA